MVQTGTGTQIGQARSRFCVCEFQSQLRVQLNFRPGYPGRYAARCLLNVTITTKSRKGNRRWPGRPGGARKKKPIGPWERRCQHMVADPTELESPLTQLRYSGAWGEELEQRVKLRTLGR